MTENAKELVNMIRESSNSEDALVTATVVILSYQKQHESSVEQAPVCLQALG